jgi:alpha-amylase
VDDGRVAVDGFGLEPVNHYGAHQWMLDVDMDCSRTQGGWFETKAFVTNGDGWEPPVHHAGAPWSSTNHFARCGAGTVLRWGEDGVKTFELGAP